MRECAHFCSPHPQPLSHAVGAGCRGARRCALQRVPHPPPAREGDKGGEGNTVRLPVHACAGKNSPCFKDFVPNRCTLIPITEPEFIIAPLLQVPPASRGEPSRAPVRFPLLAGGTLRRGFSFIRAFTNSGCAIGISVRIGYCSVATIPALPQISAQRQQELNLCLPPFDSIARRDNLSSQPEQ